MGLTFSSLLLLVLVWMMVVLPEVTLRAATPLTVESGSHLMFLLLLLLLTLVVLLLLTLELLTLIELTFGGLILPPVGPGLISPLVPPEVDRSSWVCCSSWRYPAAAAAAAAAC